MDGGSTPTRRRTLRLAGVLAVAGLAGCTDNGPEDADQEESDGGEDSPEEADSEDSSEDEDPPEESDDGEDSSGEDDSDDSGDELDLREANVVAVDVERDGDAYRFDVALHHDDDGEDGYANWWQVERLDRTRLGRRELLHAHSEQPFTRSETVEIPDDVTCVVVRGHDQIHGYGGRAMLVDLDSDESRAVDQGSEKRPFERDDCP